MVFGHAHQFFYLPLGCIQTYPDPATENTYGLQITAAGDDEVFIFCAKTFGMKMQIQQTIIGMDMPVSHGLVGVEVKLCAPQ